MERDAEMRLRGDGGRSITLLLRDVLAGLPHLHAPFPRSLVKLNPWVVRGWRPFIPYN